MIIFAQNISTQTISNFSKEENNEFYDFDQVKELVFFLPTISKNDEKITFWVMHFLMKIHLSCGLLKNLFRETIRSLSQVLQTTDSLSVFEIICDFILFISTELSKKELQNLISGEVSTFVALLLHLDSKIMKIIHQDIEVGFKAIRTASFICSYGCRLNLLTSSQNCFIHALSIFRSLGISKSENRHLLSKSEILFINSLLQDSESLKDLIKFFMTYAFLINNKDKTIDLFLKNLETSSLLLLFQHGSIELKKTLMWMLSNIYIDLPMIQSKR